MHDNCPKFIRVLYVIVIALYIVIQTQEFIAIISFCYGGTCWSVECDLDPQPYYSACGRYQKSECFLGIHQRSTGRNSNYIQRLTGYIERPL